MAEAGPGCQFKFIYVCLYFVRVCVCDVMKTVSFNKNTKSKN
jgi:hypothetical protein